MGGIGMEDDLPSFIKRYRMEQDQLRNELRLYLPLGPMRLWMGRSTDHLEEVTSKRVSEIEHEIARLEGLIQFAAVLVVAGSA